MIDENKIAQYNAEMTMHANGAAQYLSALIGGSYVTREQTRDMLEFLFAGTKRNIESDAEIRRREYLMNMLKPLMGL